jgi:hypothetical protein
MVERVLVQQVRLVDQEDGHDSLLGKLLDVGGDRPEDVAGGLRTR